ncbi:Type I secretion system ATP-binding protein PrsD [Methyloligella halotolerans]|uniref:Type I secretion system ATP-binding protein PrsD n=1 Tax=Methyloligella halotolerans TaxID=1177755 RepID=A0A1E2RX29_9HYPH|nr:Type I secretion system ATP-binding protein PrsD [Methyloligella halotolerans]
MMSRVGTHLDESLSSRVYSVIAKLPFVARGQGDGLRPIRDLDQIRSFLSGGGPTALFDLPWIPVYLGLCFLFHPLIGIAALAGGAILLVITLLAEYLSRAPSAAAAELAASRNGLLEATRRNAEAVHAMGMAERLNARWSEVNAGYLEHQRRAYDVAGGLSTLSRALRLLIQSVILGLGAYLVIKGQASAGVIIASSILVSRALAPVELAVANWRGFVGARQSWKSLREMLARIPAAGTPLELPRPEESLSVAGVATAPPASPRIVVRDVSFDLKAGDALGIIGPSGAGKSSLARTLVGVWPLLRGRVSLDGAALEHWSSQSLGAHIGYLPQNVELFDGTVAENISRFDPEAGSDAILKAAKAAGVHELILSLPAGYDTIIGEAGEALSAGQRQRVALARALYGDPFLVVLDEPNANLDEVGDEALTSAIASVRERGGIAVVVAHRPSALAAANLILVLVEGRIERFGPKEKMLHGLVRQPASAA